MKTQNNPNVGNGSDSEHSLPLLVGGKAPCTDHLFYQAEAIKDADDKTRWEYLEMASHAKRMEKLVRALLPFAQGCTTNSNIRTAALLRANEWLFPVPSNAKGDRMTATPNAMTNAE